jgi:ABC transport system ATP-binding/permease protein
VRLQECTKFWDGRKFIDSFSYDFAPGERLGVVGPNGAGKTTLLNMIAGVEKADEGTWTLGDTSVIGYFTQHPPEVDPKLQVIDYLESVADKACAPLLSRFEDAVSS